jgi:flavodoxin
VSYLVLYHFTGTGNSRWIARRIAERLGGSAISIPDVIDQPVIRTDADIVVIVFPSCLAGLHGVPLIVERFLGKLQDAQHKRVFAICNCGGHEIVNAVPSMRRFRRAARSLGIRLAAEYTVRLPMKPA